MAKNTTSLSVTTARWSVADLLRVALGFGFLVGAVEAVATAIRSRIMGRIVFTGPEMVWQLPLTNAMVFLVVGLVLALTSLLWRRVRTPAFVLALFSGLFSFAVLLLTEKIHVAAEALLAAALGIAVARPLAARSDLVRRTLRVAVPVAVLALGALAVGQRYLRQAGERRQLASLASAVGRPNILLLVLDTVRAWSLGLYGYGRPTTPRLLAWAETGAVFERALAPSSWTTPSHAVMFTGRYPTELSVNWRSAYDGAFPTLAGVLQGAGYATAGFAGNYLNVGRGTGLGQGFLHYEDYPLEPVQALRSTSLAGRLLQLGPIRALIGKRRMIPGLPGSAVNRRFLNWLDSKGERPWFAFLNYFDAHGPYLPPAPFDTMYLGRADPPVDRYLDNLQRAYGPPPIPIEVVSVSLDAYDGAISYLDGQVDALLRGLAERGQLGNTIVVVTSDHGELFGEHRLLEHGNNLYLPVLHVPLLIVGPGRVPRGVRIPSIASLRDLPATLLDLAGVPNPGLPGHSLTALWSRGPAFFTDTLLATLDFNRRIPTWPPSPVLMGDMRSVVLDSLQYIRNGDGSEEFYHLGRDAWQIRNLVGATEYRADLERYRGALKALPQRE